MQADTQSQSLNGLVSMMNSIQKSLLMKQMTQQLMNLSKGPKVNMSGITVL